MENARQAALKVLIAFRRDKVWPDLYLKRACEGMTTEETALCTALTYGVLENLLLLDYWIDAFSTVPVRKMTPPLAEILRLAVYQLAFMDKIPESAAVNEAVKQARAAGKNPRAPGFCNAVLRRIATEKIRLPQPEGDTATSLSIRYSHPIWLVNRLLSLLGETEAEEFLKLDNSPAPIMARVNTLKITRETLISRLGTSARLHRLNDAVELYSLRGPAADALREGLLYVQDASSMLSVLALDPKPGETVADLCAAPGGKSLMCAQLMKCKGKILSTDIHPHRVALVAENAKRYEAKIIEASVHDAALPLPDLTSVCDRVLCDVPCSGLGVIRKKPDLRYKKESDIAGLPPLQAEILRTGASYVKPGGTLVYSTCTILPEENEHQVDAFLRETPEFMLCPFTLPNIGACGGMVTLWPQRHGSDGFFIAKLTKRITV